LSHGIGGNFKKTELQNDGPKSRIQINWRMWKMQQWRLMNQSINLGFLQWP